MNTFAKFHSARRGFGRVTPVAAPVAIVTPRLVRRRMLEGAWSIDPTTGRLVCSWSEHWSTSDQTSGAETSDGADGEIPLAA